MVLRRAYYFARWRKKCLPLPTITLTRGWTARIALGVSASIYLATINKLHGDSEEGSPPSSGSRNVTGPATDKRFAFVADKSQQSRLIRRLGKEPPGIWGIHSTARCFNSGRIRIASRESRSLLCIVEGEFVTRTGNLADVVTEHLWLHLEHLFRHHEIDHSNPQPVDRMQYSQHAHPSLEAIHSLFKSAIISVDNQVVKVLLERTFSSLSKKKAGAAITATSSSSLISALYQDDVRLLHVAGLGNMRALLGRPRPREAGDDGNVKYDVHVLSVDHFPSNPAERSRIEALHPGETVIENGALFGRPYTRALGDGTLKWSPDTQARLHTDYLGAAPDPKVKTPPYISSEPDVTTIKILPGDFLVLSSRWLAECLTDEEVVGLVGVWAKKNVGVNKNYKEGSATTDSSPTASVPPILPEDLPVDLKEDNTVMYQKWNVPKRFINESEQAANHLADNAMGGADEGLRAALKEMNPTRSEGNTKPLGIVVVFFE
ncbi:phosphatase 2C-like domain-containing protein [Mycena capillaripes]|nr:phosphatase 2C-like domain-containing protein [Mycena capillaripes]